MLAIEKLLGRVNVTSSQVLNTGSDIREKLIICLTETMMKRGSSSTSFCWFCHGCISWCYLDMSVDRGDGRDWSFPSYPIKQLRVGLCAVLVYALPHVRTGGMPIKVTLSKRAMADGWLCHYLQGAEEGGYRLGHRAGPGSPNLPQSHVFVFLVARWEGQCWSPPWL